MALQTNFELFAADDKVLSIQVKNAADEAIPLADVTAITFSVKERMESSVALFTKELGEGVVISDAANGIFEVTLAGADTEALAGAYYWEAVVTDTSDGVYTTSFGYLAIKGKASRGHSYCALEEALALAADMQITENTIPSLATAQIIVETIARDIDSVIMGRGDLTLPITDEHALQMLRTLNQYGAIAAIIKSKKPINTGIAGDGGAFSYYEDKYKSGLYQLSRRSFSLVSLEAKESIFAFGTSDVEDDAPFWTRGTQF